MVAPVTLIETLAHLQQHVSAAYSRHLLLDYARRSACARLGLLFRVDGLTRQLVLVERCGRAPAPLHEHSSEYAPVPLDGLFGAPLHQQGLLRVSDVYSDPRSLPEEQSLLWRGGQVLLCSAGISSKSSGTQGVMVLCAGPETTETIATAQVENEILICAALLGAYLEDASKETLAAIDRERGRIARDIHDGAAQGIAHAIHALELAQRILEKQPQAARREIQRARETLLESLNDLRHDISALLPARLEQMSFAKAVQVLLDDFSAHEPAIILRRDEIQIKYLLPSLEAPFYRFLQEALHNVRKHARASHVTVQIQSLPGLLVAQVSDDGAGFHMEEALRQGKDVAKNGTLVGFGLRTMRERIEQAGGVLDVISKPGAGTTIKARFPLAHPPVALTGREREVLRLLVNGATNRVIASELSISVETVKSHVHHIVQKLQVKDRTQAAVLAARKQWV
ncbi:MAG TPA: LuxR C-terminal-related transcriptional regulator [Ktedonobacteraceae bacterium]|nr:LuxR C-terminal-related transcriptional regulator [Ktedonobacteraceae bacterium]